MYTYGEILKWGFLTLCALIAAESRTPIPKETDHFNANCASEHLVDQII